MQHHVMNRRFAVCMGVAVAVGACALWALGHSTETARAEDPKPITERTLSVANARLQDLAWMEGTWQAFRGTGAIEERWSAPLGDSMVGTFRWLRAEKVWMYELMAISKDNGRLYLWLKHFSRKFASWEEKDEALSFAITHIEPNKVVFKNSKYEDPQRVTYYRPVPETLIIRLEGTKDGEPTESEFQLSRVGP